MLPWPASAVQRAVSGHTPRVATARPDRILVVTPAGIGGGLHRVAGSVQMGLAGLGWDARLTSPHGPGFRGAAARRGSFKRRAEVVLDLARLLITARRWRPDAVSLHIGGPQAMRPYLLAIRLGGCRSVLVTFHTAEAERRWKDRTLRAARQCRALIVPSEASAAAHRAAGAPADLLHVVPNGVRQPAEALTRLEARANLGLPAAGFIPLFAGRLVAAKGVEDAVRAVAAVPGAALLVAGSGPARAAAEALAESIAPGRVRFLGWLGPAALDKAYAAADAFILPTVFESFGLAFAEAASFGLPAVGYRIPAVQEVVVEGGTGFLVPPGDVAALAECLARFAADPALLGAMGVAARARAREHYSEGQMASAYDRLLATAIGRP